jgi:hypothetical protein
MVEVGDLICLGPVAIPAVEIRELAAVRIILLVAGATAPDPSCLREKLVVEPLHLEDGCIMTSIACRNLERLFVRVVGLVANQARSGLLESEYKPPPLSLPGLMAIRTGCDLMRTRQIEPKLHLVLGPVIVGRSP